MKKQSAIEDSVIQDMLDARQPKNQARKILEGPGTSWRADGGRKAALSYTVQFGVEKQEEDFVKSMLTDHPVFDFKAKCGGTFSVLHTSARTRIECSASSVVGSNYTIIKDKQQGTLFLDHGSRTYLHLSRDLALDDKFKEKMTSRTEVVKGKDGQSNVVVHITRPYNIRYEISVSRNRAYRPFAREMASVVIGCADKFQEAGVDLLPVTKLGVPVAGRVYMARHGDEYRLVSSFSVSNLKVSKAPAADFAAPKEYPDLRQASRDAKKVGKPRSFGPPIRLSAIRSELKRPVHDRNLPTATTDRGDGQPVGGQPQASLMDLRDFTARNFEFPTCFNETYGSLIANLVDEKLLDDLRFLANGVSKRLSGFSGSGGHITIDWLNQMKTASDALAEGDPGGGLYVLLHDETTLDASYPKKLGLLDRLAVSNLGKLLMNGNNLSDLGLAPALQTRVNTILADGSIAPADRFASFTVEEQGQLIDAYAFTGAGTIKLDYPTSTGTQTIFYDLLNVRLDDIDFNIQINNTAVVNTLEFDADSVHLTVALPDASGKAFMTRWPTGKFWAAVGISALACIFFPPACTLTAALIAVGLFIGLDFAYVSLDLSNVMVDAHVRLVPNASNVLQPDVQLTLDADVSAFYMSVVPTGVHQILSLIYTLVANHTDLIINLLEGQLQDKLNSFLKDDLAITYPPAFGPVPLLGISNNVEFVAKDHGYVEQALDAGTMGVICPYITQVDSEVKSKILKLRDEFKAAYTDPVDAFAASGGLLGWTKTDFTKVARYYFGTVLSQNFINHYVYTLWRTQKFNYNFSTDECRRLYALLQPAFRELQGVPFQGTGMMAHLWPAVPPRTVFTPKPESEGAYYSTTFFDDVRLCITLEKMRRRKLMRLEFLFSIQTLTEIGFGGFDSSTGKLDLLKVSDRLFDIYFDLKDLAIKVIHSETQSFIRQNMTVSVTVDYSALNSTDIQKMFLQAATFALATRNQDFIPKDSGNQYIQRYALGNDAVQMVFLLVPFQENLYVSQGMSGAATAIYEGALDIDTLNKITAQLIRAFI